MDKYKRDTLRHLTFCVQHILICLSASFPLSSLSFVLREMENIWATYDSNSNMDYSHIPTHLNIHILTHSTSKEYGAKVCEKLNMITYVSQSVLPRLDQKQELECRRNKVNVHKLFYNIPESRQTVQTHTQIKI